MPKMAMGPQSMVAKSQENGYLKDQETQVADNFEEMKEIHPRGCCFLSLEQEYSDSCLLWTHCQGNLELVPLDYFLIYLTELVIAICTKKMVWCQRWSSQTEQVFQVLALQNLMAEARLNCSY